MNKQSKPIPPSTRKWWLGSLAAAVILGGGLWMARPCMSGPSTAPPQTAAQGEQKTASAIPGEEPRYTNALIREKSPYLLMHAHNPVDWYPWGEEALEKARREQKPIFLSIGYYTCHWCHVMERESFSDPAIAEIMNRNFVSIKVDREERPDLDRIYMNFVEATTLRPCRLPDPPRTRSGCLAERPGQNCAVGQ